MKIVIDLDNTIINSSKMIYELYVKDHKINKEYDSNHDWNFSELVDEKDLNSLLRYFTDKRLYSNIIEMPNAINVIKDLSRNNEIIIITKHHKDRIPITENWIKNTFKNVKVHYLNSFDKSKFSGEIFIDDRIDCLESIEGNFNKIICLSEFDWKERELLIGI
ncbi:MAG: hypothetical protein KHZ90_08525 [Veillonella parvula]|uniref:Nucleotidase n=1 Tax=Veillonella parvula TaxID=29466 RepID=A0A942WQQ1_VEIPA|nr:hypothetical protein [Veillonella parvula]MBS4893806.1 hypothetical protein [Veillonella parvula]